MRMCVFVCTRVCLCAPTCVVMESQGGCQHGKPPCPSTHTVSPSDTQLLLLNTVEQRTPAKQLISKDSAIATPGASSPKTCPPVCSHTPHSPGLAQPPSRAPHCGDTGGSGSRQGSGMEQWSSPTSLQGHPRIQRN